MSDTFDHAFEAFERMDAGECGGFSGGDPAKTCKFCGAFPLFWLNKKGRWVLIDQKGNEHRCKNSTRAADPFADADKIKRGE